MNKHSVSLQTKTSTSVSDSNWGKYKASDIIEGKFDKDMHYTNIL